MPRFAIFAQRRTNSFPVTVTDADATGKGEVLKQQIVLKFDMQCDRYKSKAMKSISKQAGVLSISANPPESLIKITSVGVDPVVFVSLLRKISSAELISIGRVGICHNPAASVNQPICYRAILVALAFLRWKRRTILLRRLQFGVAEPTFVIEDNVNEHQQFCQLTKPSLAFEGTSKGLAVDHEDDEHYQVIEKQASYLGQQSNGTDHISLAAFAFTNSCTPTNTTADANVTESQIFPLLWNPRQVSEGTIQGLPIDVENADPYQTLDEQVPYLGEESNREEDFFIPAFSITNSCKPKEDFPTQNNQGSSSSKLWSQISSSSPLEYQSWTTNQGRRRVKPPEKVFSEGYPLWENSIVGQLVNHESLTLNIVNFWAQKSWGDCNLLSVFKLTNGFYLFKFRDFSACSKVLDRSPWSVAGKFMVFRKWQPSINLNGKYLSTVPLWVKFYNVPLELWTRGGLSYVASAIGKPLDLDEPTASRSRLTHARVYVEISATDDIPSSFDLELPNGDTIEIQVAFPWKPEKCRVCKLFGHNDNTCKISDRSSC